MKTKWDKKVFNDNWSVKVAKEKANFLAEEGKDTLEQVPKERGEKRQHFPKRERSKLLEELSGERKLYPWSQPRSCSSTRTARFLPKE